MSVHNPSNIVVPSSELSDTKFFDFWPESYGTSAIWFYEHNRKVIPKAKPSIVNVEQGQVPVFHVSQTCLLTKPQTEFEVAKKEFLRRFWYHARHDVYLLISEDRTSYIDVKKNKGLGGKATWLTEQMVLNHLQGKKTYGICAKKHQKIATTTYWLAIDLDLHLGSGGNLDLFRRQLKAILSRFWGVRKSQLVVSSTKANGVHLYFYFDAPVSLNRITRHLRTNLAKLHSEHLGLAQDVENWNRSLKANFQAKNWKVKQLDQLEIYPTTNTGFRFIGVKGKVALADKLIGTTSWGNYVLGKRKGQKKIGFDLKSWWRSLNTTDRMPVSDVLAYVEARLPHSSEQVMLESYHEDNPKIPQVAEPILEPIELGVLDSEGFPEQVSSYKGNTRKKLTEFWLGINTPPKSLNSTILVTARLLAAEGLSEDESRDVIKAFIRELPSEARSCSSRLQIGQETYLNRDVNKLVHNAHRKPASVDPETARVKLATTSLAWKKCGFRLSDKSTWGNAGNSALEVLSPEWTEDDLRAFEQVLMPALKIKDMELAAEVATEVVKLTQIKAHYHQGWGYAFLKKWLPDKFSIPCAKPQKQQDVLAALRRLQVIKQLAIPVPRVRATIWELGQRATARIDGDLITEFVLNNPDNEVSTRKLEEVMQALPGIEDSPLYVAALKREKRKKE